MTINSKYCIPALIALCSLAVFPCVSQSRSAESEKVAMLFTEIQSHATLAEADADLLDSYARSGAPWELHANRVSEMTEHVNDLAKDFNQASTLRNEASDWQRAAIDQIRPLLQGMADHLSASIEHLKQNRKMTHMQPWLDYVHGNREYAFRTATLIRDYVSYGEAKAKLETLAKSLALQPNGD
ncbi:hypothetical protein DYQ86_09745 [Acidobacteria bacterium AB60]|nr:hypothetical protein DYQ86_09745 [Acidobacteria bacterium AB60]